MPIFRLFDTSEDAMAAVAELKQAGIGRIGIQLAARTADEVSAEAMTAKGLPEAQARRFAEQVGAGGALLIVDAPFGKRPFRVHIDPTQDGAEVAFAVIDRVRNEMLHRVGFSDLLHPRANG